MILKHNLIIKVFFYKKSKYNKAMQFWYKSILNAKSNDRLAGINITLQE